MRLPSLVLLSACLPLSHAAAAAQAETRQTIALDHPAFLQLVPSVDVAGGRDLMVSSFGFFGPNTLSRVPLAGVTASEPQVTTSRLRWPNDITSVPSEVFGPGYVAVGAGFLTPTYTTGEVAISQIATGETFSLSKPKAEYFYHRVIWADMNGDGRLDALTARAKKPMFGASDGELVWFEQPAAAAALKAPWTEHVIAKGPDVYVAIADLAGDGSKQVIAAEFFSEKLTVLWQEQGEWQRRVIDDQIGAVFDLSLADLNHDGKLDLLVTNHRGEGQGGIFAYEIPADFKAGAWTRHALLSGIATKVQGLNVAAPGSAIAWAAKSGEKPYVLAAGDGSGSVHLLKPTSQASDDWSYSADTVLDTESTIGGMALGTEQRDHTTPLYVPAYDESKIYVLNLRP